MNKTSKRRIDPRLTDAGFAKLMAQMGMPDPEPKRTPRMDGQTRASG